MSTPQFRTRALAVAAIAVLTLATASCGSDGTTSGSSTTITVFAASSLSGAFADLGKQFEKSHHGVTVTFNFAGSSDLVSQIQSGAPADVFASADTKNMDKLTSAHLEGQVPLNFASNTLEIITPADNPAKIRSLDDLTGKGVDLVICAPEVPCGSAAAKVAASAGLTFKPVSEEQSVKDVLAKVSSGDADAGLVYVTDVQAAGKTVRGITFPGAAAAANIYPITSVKGSDNPTLAKEFVDLVLSAAGQDVLATAGFAKP